LTSFALTLAEVEPGRKQVLIVEDWAEIRRLRRSEGVSIVVDLGDRAGDGLFAEHCEGGVS